MRLFTKLVTRCVRGRTLIRRLHRTGTTLVTRSCASSLAKLPGQQTVFRGLAALFSLTQRLGRGVVVTFVSLSGFGLVGSHFNRGDNSLFLVRINRHLGALRRGNRIVNHLNNSRLLIISLGGRGTSVSSLQRHVRRRVHKRCRLNSISLCCPNTDLNVMRISPRAASTSDTLRTTSVTVCRRGGRGRGAPFITRPTLRS